MYIIIALGILFFIIIIISLVSPKIKQNSFENNLKNALEKQNVNYTLEKAKHFSYNFNLKMQNKTYLIKLVVVPSFSEIQINSKSTWEIKYGAGGDLGKAQPYKKYMQNNIDAFMAIKPNDTEQKVVVIIPNARKIVMYINECEIIFVDKKTNVYGVNVINCDDILEYLKQNIK